MVVGFSRMSVDHGRAWCLRKSCDVGVGVLRCGGGKGLHNVVYAIVGVLKFHCHGTHDVMDVCGVGLERVRGCFNSLVRIEIDVVCE